jgi:acyl-CoA thioester hydrolase
VPFSHRVDVRYLEVDQQGVVFNMWYLAYFDDAMTAFLAHGGLPYAAMTDAGYDCQLVHTELDWRGSVGWGDDVRVEVALANVGRTSFTLQFRVRNGDTEVVTGSTVYVVVAIDGSGKREVPPLLRDALGPVEPLWTT